MISAFCLLETPPIRFFVFPSLFCCCLQILNEVVPFLEQGAAPWFNAVSKMVSTPEPLLSGALWDIQTTIQMLGPPARCHSLLFFWEGSPTKIDYRKSWYPYSNLSNRDGLEWYTPFSPRQGNGDPRSMSPCYCGWTKLKPWETIGNHCLLVFTGESNHSRVSWVVRNGFRPSTLLISI